MRAKFEKVPRRERGEWRVSDVPAPQTSVGVHSFRIYVAGATLGSQLAVANLRGLCEAALMDGFDVEVVDVLEDPDRATRDRVMATPTVIRLAPAPLRRVMGDLSDHEVAARAPGLTTPGPAAPPAWRPDGVNRT